MVGPVAGVRSGVGVVGAVGSQRKRFAITIGPAVAVGVLDSVEQTVPIGVGFGRVGGGAEGQPTAVVSPAGGTHSGNDAGMLQNRVEGRIEVALGSPTQLQGVR